MAITIYRSDDTSAPVLSGTAGALIGVLDACLVNGYGSKSAAGFAKEFSGTNKAAYRAAVGNRLRLRVDDTGTTTARIVGYETMTDVDTGTNAFPTAAQFASGLYVTKSASADSTARPWILIADAQAFFLIIGSANTVIGQSSAADSFIQFGDGKSYKTSDAYCTTIIGGNGAGSGGQMMAQLPSSASTMSASTAHYVARAYTQIGTSVQFMKTEACIVRNSTIVGGDTSKNVYPDPVSGGILLSPAIIAETGPSSTVAVRGQVGGLWMPQMSLVSVTNHLDTFDGVSDLAGTSFIILKGYNATNEGRMVIQTSGSWR